MMNHEIEAIWYQAHLALVNGRVEDYERLMEQAEERAKLLEDLSEGGY